MRAPPPTLRAKGHKQITETSKKPIGTRDPTGKRMEFINPYRRTGQLNEVERWKLERHPLEVATAVRERYSRLGPEAIAEIPGEQERLKWVGLYPQRQGGNSFMMRIKVPGGRLSVVQAKEVGRLAEAFANPPEGVESPTAGVCDITTRQDVQMHWIRIEDVPEIWDRLEAVGLTTLQACGDSARNVTCCPVSGVDPKEVVSAYPVAEAISRYFTGNREYANLPRKFKISVTGCVEDCAQAEINDVALRPARHPSGEVGFCLLVGGGLSDGPRLASPLDVFLRPDEVPEAVRAVAQVWGELGNRENRGLARLRYLVAELGPAQFRDELAKRTHLELRRGGEDLTAGYRSDHLGVHPQVQAGLYYVGCNVVVGRIRGADLVRFAELSTEYGDQTLRLTNDQNLLLTGVREDVLDELLSIELLSTYSPFPGPFERGAVACTGNEFCRFAVIETKARMVEIARQLDRRFGDALMVSRSDSSQDLPSSATKWPKPMAPVVRIHLSGCSASCAQPQVADVGLRGATAHRADSIVEAVDVALGGSLGTEARLADFVDTALPADEATEGLARLIQAWIETGSDGESFGAWTRRIGAEVARDLLRGPLPKGRIL